MRIVAEIYKKSGIAAADKGLGIVGVFPKDFGIKIAAVFGFKRIENYFVLLPLKQSDQYQGRNFYICLFATFWSCDRVTKLRDCSFLVLGAQKCVIYGNLSVISHLFCKGQDR